MVAFSPSALIHSCSLVYLRSDGQLLRFPLALSLELVSSQQPKSAASLMVKLFSVSYRREWERLVPSLPGHGFPLLARFPQRRIRSARRLTRCFSLERARENRW